MQMKILNLAQPTPGDPDFYRRWQEVGMLVGRGITSDTFSPKHSFWPSFPDVEILVVDQRVPITEKLLRHHLPSVRYVVSATTGHTHLQFDPKNLGIRIVTLRGETDFLSGVRSVSEFVFRLMLSLTRPLSAPGTLLAGKSLGIVGLGRIGKHVLHLANGFGMVSKWYDMQHSFGHLERIFRESDFISLHVSESKETRHLVDSTLIAMMKPGAYLINTARGSILDEKALVDALRQGRIAGAALDVIEQSREFFEDVPNLILSPHIAGSTLEDRIKTDEFVLKKLKRFMREDGFYSDPSGATPLDHEGYSDTGSGGERDSPRLTPCRDLHCN